MKTKLLITWTLIFVPVFLFAQWVNDPAVNTYIAGNSNEQWLPRIAVANDGSYFISSFQFIGPPTETNVYLHRLDSNGNKLWDNDGLLISDNINRSWISDYSLIADQDNAAVLAFCDIRAGTGNTNVYAYRTSADSNFLWGNNGISLSDNLYDEYSPVAIETVQGDFIFAWTRIYDDHLFKTSVVIRKVTSSGQIVWNNDVELFNSDSTYCEPKLIAADNDNFIVVWCALRKVGSGPGEEFFKYIYTQKYDSSGNEIWPAVVPVCDLDTNANVVPRYVLPAIESDMNNGVYVSWFDARVNHLKLNSYIQHIDSGGNAVWTDNGILVSTNTNNYQVGPHMEYIPSSGELFVFWVEEATSPTFMEGVYGQKISASGQKMWGNNGLVVEPLNPNPYIEYTGLFVKASSDDDIVLIFNKDSIHISVTDTFIFTDIYATRIDGSGQYVWNDEKVMISSYMGWKMLEDVSDFGNDQWVSVWVDDRPDLFWPGKVYAQNIKMNGELGISTGIEIFGANSNSSLKIYPNPFNESLSIAIEVLSTQNVELSIYNIQGKKVRSLFDGKMQSGINTVIWDGKDDNGNQLSNGIYLCALETEDSSVSKRCVLLK